MAEPTLEESIEVLLARVPEPVRDFVIAEFTASVQKLMQKHQLHVDQGGVLQKELLLMLLGQEEPAEFMKELRTAGIPEETVQALIKDINEDIFKPLRSREQAPRPAAEVPPQPVQAPRPIAPAAPAPEIPVDTRGVRTMSADEQSVTQTPPPVQPQQVWQPQPYAQPQYPPMQPVYTPYPPPYMPAPQPQTYWVPVSVPQQPMQPQYQYPPQPVVPTAPAPTPEPKQEVPMPESRPTPPPPPIPATEQAWTPPSAALPPQPQAPPPLMKEFGADPYREPI